MRRPRSGLGPAFAFAALFGLCVFRFDLVEALIAPVAVRKTVFADRESLAVLALQHLALTAATSAASFAAAFPLALLAFRAGSRHLRELFLKLAAFGESIPTPALIALLVPALGYGFPPVALALFLYGLLPVFRNTISGLEATPPEALEAARGCGMTERQTLFRVRLPHAAPLVIQGARVSLVVNTAAATVGAAVGAGGLGVPIVAGIRSFDTVLVLKGALPVALLALAIDAALRTLEAEPEPRR